MRMRNVRPDAEDLAQPATERVNTGPNARRHRTFRAHHDKPVFHDRSGRRRRRMTLIVSGAGTLTVLLLTTLALALTGNSPVSLPGFPDATRNAGRAHARVTPAPNETGATPGPNGSGALVPGSTVSATTLNVTPTPGASATPTPSVTHGKKPTQTPSHPAPSRSK